MEVFRCLNKYTKETYMRLDDLLMKVLNMSDQIFSNM
jgi:hypothetical protein